MKIQILLLSLLCLFATGCSESREDKYIRLNTEMVRLEAQKKLLGLEVEEFLYPDGAVPERLSDEEWNEFHDKFVAFSSNASPERKAAAEKRAAEVRKKGDEIRKKQDELRKEAERRKTDPYYKTRQSKIDDLDAQITELEITIVAIERT